MNERSFIMRLFPMAAKRLEPLTDRREQILRAALRCFGECGFHQTTMHDISARAQISVGLIYRYFKNKDEVIAALAAEHKKTIAALLVAAGKAPSLLEAMELLFTSHCQERTPRVVSAFVVDLFAEAARNPRVAKVVRDLVRAKRDGVAQLIARSPEWKGSSPRLDPQAIAEMIFAVNDGTMMRNVLRSASTSASRQREAQLCAARTLWRLLFQENKSNGNGHK